MKVDHKERAHALLSASGSSRWLECTPSARLESEFEDKSSSFAEEGTLAHELAELKLSNLYGSEDLRAVRDENIGLIRLNALYAPDMDDFTDVYVDYIQEVYNEALQRDPAAIVETEVRVNLTKYVPEGFGTVDNAIIAGTTLDVIDLKYGKGVRVSATNNSQLKLYALGALEMYAFNYDIETVRLHIHQPRLDAVSVFEISAQDLLAWGTEVVIPRAELAHAGEGEQVTGTWCQFCKAKNRCAALAREAEALAQLDFVEPKLLTDAQVLEVYAKADRMIRWLSGLGDYMLAEALAGKPWEGYKLVEGRSNRKLTETEKVIETLESDGFQPSDYLKSELQGITALEKLMGKKTFESLLGQFVTKAPGKPTLVEAADKRPAIDLTSDFD